MTEEQRRRAEQVAGQILSIARREGLEPGARLIEQRLAEALGLSRGPIRAGLRHLADTGVISGKRNCGFALTKSAYSSVAKRALAAENAVDIEYQKLADDCLEHRLPSTVTEAELMRRYDLTRPETSRLLKRVAAEGWIERLPGYGWKFAESVTNEDAQRQVSEFRASIEPAALSAPNYHLDQSEIDRLRKQQTYIYKTGVLTLTNAELFQSGCAFHEGLIRGANNPFFYEALKRVNSIRRLFAYRSYANRQGMKRHIEDHLRLLDLLEKRRTKMAVKVLLGHLREPLV